MEPSEKKPSSINHPLTDSFKERWEKEFRLSSNPELEESWNQMNSVFDKCIDDNRKGKYDTHVLPMLTGSGKTQGAIHKCKNLPDETFAIIVTYRTADADEIACAIGDTACSYHMEDIDDRLKGLVNKVDDVKDTLNYDTVVITHSMLKKILEYPVNDPKKRKEFLFHRKGGYQRDLVIIDEQIDLYNKHEVDLDKLKAISQLFERLTKEESEYSSDSELKKNLKVLNQEIENLSGISESFTPIEGRPTGEPVSFKDIGYEEDRAFDRMIAILEKEKVHINKYLTGLDKKVDKDNEKQVEELEDTLEYKYIKTLEDLMEAKRQWHYVQKSGDKISLHSADELILQKTAVILDATASENHLYQVNDKHKEHLHVYEQIKSRSFKNLTINVITANTGKTGILNEKKTLAEELSKEISDITTPTDKIMVVSFKDFNPTLTTYLPTDRNVVTANWGNVTGSNAYKDTNVQFIYGLPRKPHSVYHTGQAMARMDIQSPLYSKAKPLEGKGVEFLQISDTDLVQDVIQAIMRTQARKAIDSDGNCDPTTVYITLDSNIKTVMVDALQRYLPGVKINDYKPKKLSGKIKPRIADGIFHILKTRLKIEGEDISFEEVREQLELETRQLNDVTRKSSFISELELLGYEIYVPPNQKDKQGRTLKRGKKYFLKSKR